MPQASRIPPGRAGRMWLHRRLAVAERGREQLDRKLRILLPELQRRRLQADRLGREWAAAYAEARTWLLRVVLLGGEDAVLAASAVEPARVEVTWAGTMGLGYPAGAELVVSEGTPTVPPANAAVVPAARAFEAALRAGVRTAAAEEAVRRVEAEIAVTRRRMRALERRWTPWLRQALAEREAALEQTEREDGVRLRRAAGADGVAGPRGGGAGTAEP
ncbi:V-type ATP synthase subunit D [Nocardioides sp. MAHUQ-72]|uniref:V-type ATP synthase subunit D n=1 Tax=unclassified Nocardioides TaxID=2615069 RepID=UPI00360B3720